MTAVLPILLAAAWCGLHLGAYLGGLRNLATLRTERGIFLFHAVPVPVAGVALLLWLAVAPDQAARWTGAFGAASLMGLYAISFLELWSLSEGSYSLSILAAVARRGTAQRGDLDALAAIGTAKQKARTDALLDLKLARRDAAGRLAITGRGRVAAAASAALLWLAAIGRSG